MKFPDNSGSLQNLNFMAITIIDCASKKKKIGVHLTNVSDKFFSGQRKKAYMKKLYL